MFVVMNKGLYYTIQWFSAYCLGLTVEWQRRHSLPVIFAHELYS